MGVPKTCTSHSARVLGAPLLPLKLMKRYWPFTGAKHTVSKGSTIKTYYYEALRHTGRQTGLEYLPAPSTRVHRKIIHVIKIVFMDKVMDKVVIMVFELQREC
jgi:hypothetical protein